MKETRYFSDVTGEPVEVVQPHPMANAEFSARWPSIKGFSADGYTKWVAYPVSGKSDPLPITRRMEPNEVDVPTITHRRTV